VLFEGWVMSWVLCHFVRSKKNENKMGFAIFMELKYSISALWHIEGHYWEHRYDRLTATPNTLTSFLSTWYWDCLTRNCGKFQHIFTVGLRKLLYHSACNEPRIINNTNWRRLWRDCLMCITDNSKIQYCVPSTAGSLAGKLVAWSAAYIA
jgi:hypothetical protein